MATINFSGLASGIDSTALIDATKAAAEQTRVKPSQTKISELEDTNTAFTDIKTKLSTLKDKLSEFTIKAGGGVSKSATSSKESSLTASATNAAVNGSYSVTVNQLARNHIVAFNNAGYTSDTAAIQSTLTGAESAADRTVTFDIGTGSNLKTVSVEITNGSFTLNQFVTAFNAAAATQGAGAEASLVNKGTSSSPVYAVVISSSNEGIEKGQIATSFSGTTALSNMTGYTEQAAQNASFDISGIGTITRSSNSVSDVLLGVTMNLVSAGTSTLKVSVDAETTKSKIQEFVDSYNELVQYINDNNQVTRDESSSEVKSIFGPLASTSIDNGVLTTLRETFASTNYSAGTSVKILSSLGITTERDGTLLFNADDFKGVTNTGFNSAITNDPNGVSGVLQQLAESLATQGGIIDQYIGFNRTIDLAINGNKTLISDLNKRIAEAEARIEKEADNMRARFARLESLTSKLQGQQNSLTSALAGLK